MGRVIIVTVIALVVLCFLSPNSEQGGQLLHGIVMKYPCPVEVVLQVLSVALALLCQNFCLTLSSVQVRLLWADSNLSWLQEPRCWRPLLTSQHSCSELSCWPQQGLWARGFLPTWVTKQDLSLPTHRPVPDCSSGGFQRGRVTLPWGETQHVPSAAQPQKNTFVPDWVSPFCQNHNPLGQQLEENKDGHFSA